MVLRLSFLGFCRFAFSVPVPENWHTSAASCGPRAKLSLHLVGKIIYHGTLILSANSG
jgi:hypothetical protein